MKVLSHFKESVIAQEENDFDSGEHPLKLKNALWNETDTDEDVNFEAMGTALP